MYCLDCGQPLVPSIEKALSGETQMVRESTVTHDWVCRATGNEHRAGTASDYADRVRRVLTTVKQMHEDEDMTAEQALQVVLIDCGIIEPPEDFARALNDLRDT